MSSLNITDLNAGYGKVTILKGITLSDVKPGEFVGLIGPNASGKSTLFKSIAGIVRPRTGTIRLGDIDLVTAGRAQRSRRVAYMPQAYGCNAVLSVFECILLALKQASRWRVSSDDLDRVADILVELELSHLADKGISQLSGGQAQMVAVAQTLVRQPDLVLLDEPTSALDLHHQLSILATVRRVMKQRGTIVIAALHDLNLAAQFCDRLVLLGSGEILADGPPGKVLALSSIEEIYRVKTTLEQTRRNTFYVDARLSA
ncbi:ABC transporter ATP-binding protein [Kiloniella laminariae]|uniref:ABC transporter ATP-binding protein n=1 Tax=Kiloniella laminariae TaxID=454162 RepID=UPI00036DAC33|nr:ABC transporter ATP-binding protein [Kiloniella laminariae]